MKITQAERSVHFIQVKNYVEMFDFIILFHLARSRLHEERLYVWLGREKSKATMISWHKCDKFPHNKDTFGIRQR